MIYLKQMTLELCHELFKNWENDVSIYEDMNLFKPYLYNKATVDLYFKSKNEPSRIIFAIMLNDKVIGELQLKNIDLNNKECTLSIHMQNDLVKNKGYGSKAERLAIQFAFGNLKMNSINANTIKKNTRSAHVLEKVGFHLIKEDETFKYYRIQKSNA